MSKIEELLAKSNPNQTLFQHTDKAYSIWKQIYNSKKNKIDSDFWTKSLISVLFHDIGKVIDSFQEMMKNPIKFAYNRNFRHELFSGFIVAILLKNNILPATAVFSHHKNLDGELFDNDKYKNLFFKLTYIKEFYKHYEKTLLEYNYTFPIDTFDKIKNFNAEKFYLGYKKLTNENFSKIKLSDRKKYIFYKGILQTCDWLSSGNNTVKNDLKIEKNDLKDKLEKKIKKTITFSNFQIKCFKIELDCLTIAPTGSGKTEASLLWSGKKNGKILYLLPTRVTSNAIYQRMKDYFDTENVGLVHSSAYSYHKEIDDNYQHSYYLLEKTFYMPLTVATVDQLLTCGFNIGYWEMKEFNCLDARIIIDEIHSYDFYTLGLIIATIRHFKEVGAKFFIMSATIPIFLKKLIREELPNIKLIENKLLMENARNYFVVNNCTIDDLNDEVKKEVEKGKKVLIVVNTVNEAIRLYEKYIKYKQICYHSRFISKDRKSKEDEIIDVSEGEFGKLVITTQVVEVSLDIDFDILFTENAPADAIVQRAGRVNRKREKKNTKVVIFKHTEKAEFIYAKELLEKTFLEFQKYNNKMINESELIQIVEAVYKDINIRENQNYLEGLCLYEEIQEHNNFIQDVSLKNEDIYTRKIKNRKISVIPMQFLEELSGESKDTISKYLVDVSIWVSKKNKSILQNGFIYCDVDYNYERGVKLGNMPVDYSQFIL